MIELGVFVLLLCLGYWVGSRREKRHYESILEREEQLRHIMVFTSRFAPDPARCRGGELVQGNVVISADYFKIFVAALRKLVGGRLRSYESLLDRGRREAVLRMKEQAVQNGANQIFNVKMETSSVSKGEQSTLGSIEVLAYGTAIRSA